MRELADQILANCLRLPAVNNWVSEDFEIIDSFFEVAKNQNWVSISELSKIQESYGKIKEELKKIPAAKPGAIIKKEPTIEPEQKQAELIDGNLVNVRQQKILEVLRKKDKVQVWQLKEVFPEVTKRTLRRDFRYLLKQGLIERFGERNETFYKIKMTNDKAGREIFSAA